MVHVNGESQTEGGADPLANSGRTAEHQFVLAVLVKDGTEIKEAGSVVVDLTIALPGVDGTGDVDEPVLTELGGEITVGLVTTCKS